MELVFRNNHDKTDARIRALNASLREHEIDLSDAEEEIAVVTDNHDVIYCLGGMVLLQEIQKQNYVRFLW